MAGKVGGDGTGTIVQVEICCQSGLVKPVINHYQQVVKIDGIIRIDVGREAGTCSQPIL